MDASNPLLCRLKAAAYKTINPDGTVVDEKFMGE